jgi:hypothetical protein
MQNANIKNNIISLFKEAEQKHRKEFQTGIIEDPEWPLWFAEHMKEKLEENLNKHFTIGELFYLLTSAEKAHKKNAPETDWAYYCANFFINRH